jgi:hypothetical protein
VHLVGTVKGCYRGTPEEVNGITICFRHSLYSKSNESLYSVFGCEPPRDNSRIVVNRKTMPAPSSYSSEGSGQVEVA